ncbi:zinc-binding domain-containing protein [Lasiosphaeria ovina]|uniref:Zinc-binding domain-containing protein n=1 Tax=Lasiosphaeria ovina TaxID=92902 RepID=A0AAE0KFU2_9PEZI|nr:zinc-binding domain-containing protein [Lasiosphaeria ovina]
MAGKRNNRCRPQDQTSSNGHAAQDATVTLPSLHEAVLAATGGLINPSPWFNHSAGLDGEATAVDEYSTNIMAHFQCPNSGCGRAGWGSKKVGILIRRYYSSHHDSDINNPNVWPLFGAGAGAEAMGYDAVVFNQRCKRCNGLGAMAVDEGAYVERVAYRLKKWAGVPMATQVYAPRLLGPEHESELCEGCKAGYCMRSAIRQHD